MNSYQPLLPYVGTDEMHGELSKFFMGTGGAKGKQMSLDEIKKMVDDKSKQGANEFESLNAQLENQLADIGKTIRGALDAFTEHTLTGLEIMANAISATMEAITNFITWIKNKFS